MPKTILAVDDSESIRQLVQHTLSAAGYAVISAADGQAALDIARQQAADLVLTDVHMPRLDGIELVRALRALPHFKFVPILMLTTESSAARKSEGKQAGATGWIVKPFQPQTLLDTVAKVV